MATARGPARAGAGGGGSDSFVVEGHRAYLKRGRWYLDLRKLTGHQEAIALEPGGRAVTERAVAEQLAGARVRDLQDASRTARASAVTARVLGLDPSCDMVPVAARHLRIKRVANSPEWVGEVDMMLDRAIHYFQSVQPGEDPRAWTRRGVPADPRNMATISTSDVLDYVEWLKRPCDDPGFPGQRRPALGPGRVRHHLAVLSGLYSTAVALQHQVTNPVPAAMKRVARRQRSRTVHLEADDLARLLEAARHHHPRRSGKSEPLACVYPLLAFFVYTGVRQKEARRARVEDLDFARGEVLVRGATKGRTSSTEVEMERERFIPLAPELVRILKPYVAALGRSAGILFPRPDGRPFGDWRKALARVSLSAGFAADRMHVQRFRVSYATHRSACPGVTINEVRTEGGWSDLEMLARVYGRARRRPVPFEKHLDFSLPYVARFVPELQDWRPARILANTASDRHARRAEVVRPVVARFMSLREGRTLKQFATDSGVTYSLVRRLSGGQGTVQNRVLEQMRAYIRAAEEEQAA